MPIGARRKTSGSSQIIDACPVGCVYAVVGNGAEKGSGLLWNRRQDLRSGTEMAQTQFLSCVVEPLLELSVLPGDASYCSANTSSGLQAGIADFLLLY